MLKFISILITMLIINTGIYSQEKPLTIEIEKCQQAYPGSEQDVNIFISKPDDLSAFKFLFGYNRQALTFKTVIPMENIKYAHFRFEPILLPGDHNDTNIGLIYVAGLINDISTDKKKINNTGISLFKFKFLISKDRTYECALMPIKFFWTSCDDNVLIKEQNRFLATDVIDSMMYYGEHCKGGSLNTDLDFKYIHNLELPCMTSKIIDDKCIFINSWISTVSHCCEPTSRGDLNLDGIPFTLQDARIYADLLIGNTTLLDTLSDVTKVAINEESDVNNDGKFFTIEDFASLFKIIIGDAFPYGKPVDSSPTPAIFSLSNNILYLNRNDSLALDAVYLEINGFVEPILEIPGLEMKSNYDDKITKVIIYTLTPDLAVIPGRLLSGLKAPIRKIDAADTRARPVKCVW